VVVWDFSHRFVGIVDIDPNSFHRQVSQVLRWPWIPSTWPGMEAPSGDGWHLQMCHPKRTQPKQWWFRVAIVWWMLVSYDDLLYESTWFMCLLGWDACVESVRSQRDIGHSSSSRNHSNCIQDLNSKELFHIKNLFGTCGFLMLPGIWMYNVWVPY